MQPGRFDHSQDLHLTGATPRAGADLLEGSKGCLQGEKDRQGTSREQEQASLGDIVVLAVVRQNAVVADSGEVAREQVPAEAGEELGARRVCWN